MKTAARLEAEILRRRGRSIKHIAQKVHVSQSTASRWCSKITLTLEQRESLVERRREAGMKALAPWIEKNRNLKITDIQNQTLHGRSDLKQMSKRDLFILGLGLYWGEGYKRGSQEWGFTNSDPEIIRVILIWLRECYGVPVDRIIARLTINLKYRNHSDRLMRMWTHETGIPFSQFNSSTFIPGYSGSRLQERTYRGTLRIKVRRGTSLRRRILASIAEIENQIPLSSWKTLS